MATYINCSVTDDVFHHQDFVYCNFSSDLASLVVTIIVFLILIFVLILSSLLFYFYVKYSRERLVVDYDTIVAEP